MGECVRGLAIHQLGHDWMMGARRRSPTGYDVAASSS